MLFHIFLYFKKQTTFEFIKEYKKKKSSKVAHYSNNNKIPGLDQTPKTDYLKRTIPNDPEVNSKSVVNESGGIHISEPSRPDHLTSRRSR